MTPFAVLRAPSQVLFGTGMAEAASVPLVALTAWQALVEMAGLRQGQKVFVQAGSGGMSLFL